MDGVMKFLLLAILISSTAIAQETRSGVQKSDPLPQAGSQTGPRFVGAVTGTTGAAGR